MRIGRDEAMEMFKKWEQNRTSLRCDLLFAQVAARFRAKVANVEEERIEMHSQEMSSELVLRLEEGLDFAYAEPRVADAKEAVLFEGGLAIFFPNGDTIHILEIAGPVGP